jgi:hypothetical protein
LFVAFFGVIAATLRELLGEELVAADRCGMAAIAARASGRCLAELVATVAGTFRL